MARTKTSEQKHTSGDMVVLADSTQLDQAQNEPKHDKPLTDVVTLYSRLSRSRDFILGRDDVVTIPSPNDGVKNGQVGGIVNGASILFTMDRSKWEYFLKSFGNTAVILNGLIGECSEAAFNDMSTRTELKSIKNGYEASDGNVSSDVVSPNLAVAV